MRPIEEEIFLEFKNFGTSRGLSPKSSWIKNYLLEVQQAFPYSMWRGFRRFSLECFKKGVNLRVGTYASFRNYLRVLKRLDLIQGAKPWKPHSFEKHWVSLNKDNLNSEAWKNPLAALYPSTDWKRKTRKERAGIQRKVRMKKGKKRGRPKARV